MQIPPNRLLRGSLLTVVYLLGILGIAASGGGGGGGDDDGPTSISYSGNTDPAVISRSNAARLVGNVLIGQTIVGSSSGGAAKSGTSVDTTAKGIGLAQFPGHLTQKLRNAMQSSSNLLPRSTLVRARTDVDETEPCDNSGGSVRTTGFIEDNGTGTLIFEYTNCLEDGETLDGTVTAQVNAFDFAFLVPTDVIYSFGVLTLTSSTINVSLSGSIHSQVSIGTHSEQLTVDRLVTRDNATGEMIMITNQVSMIDYDNIFSPSSFSETITGRIYDSAHGYVDFTTIVSITFSTITQEYPDGGQLLLTGSLNSGIQLTVISDTHTNLQLDLDSDSFFEVTFILSWTELETEPDLTDSDSDGMRDSWELANGLDPLNPADAGGDLDSDGFTNLEEYNGGSDPNSASSTPPTTDLSLTKGTPGIVLTSAPYTFSISVSNNGPAPAYFVEVMDILPPGVLFVDVVTSGNWNCAYDDDAVTCSRINIDVGESYSFDINVTLPPTTGTVLNTATVTTTTVDSNPFNNNASIDVIVALPASDIQSQIVAAANGDSITVSPGTYLGNIDFMGKAITLVSSSGPLATIIDGGGSTDPVVTFAMGEGNDSVLDGFTIQNGADRGLYVLNSSPTITNSIIADNTACGGGAGMELRNSSPIVRQNIIRNNSQASCMGGSGGGGMLIIGGGSPIIVNNHIIGNSFGTGGGISMSGADVPTIQGNTIDGNSGGAMYIVNASQPLIVNNIISNNSDGDCGGIDWLVPSSLMAPRVVNNTFVDNDGSEASAICADGWDTQAEIINNTIVANPGQTAIFCGNSGDMNPPIIEFNNVTASGGNLYSGICTDQTGLNGNISDDPQFVDVANDDFRLSAGSPSIDAGDNTATGLPATDIIGNNRIIDGDLDTIADIDLGAYEYTPAPSAAVNVILIIGDSMSWPRMQEMNAISPLPGLLRIMGEGAVSVHGVAAVPSLTVTNLYTLLTGAHPDSTGEVANVFIRSVSPPMDTLENLAAREGLSYQLTLSESAIDQVIAEVNNGTLANIRIAWDTSTDSVGHIEGPSSSQYENAIRAVDSKIHQLMDAIVAAGMFDSTVVMVGSDHGMEELTADGTLNTLRKVDVGAVLTAAGIANVWRGSGPRMAHIYLADPARADDAVAVLQATEGIDANVFKRSELTHLELPNDLVIELNSPNSGDVISFMLPGYSNGRTTSPFYWDISDNVVGGHGGLSLQEMHVPWLMWGGAIKDGFTMGPKHQVDHAATIAALLGVAPPLFSEGTAAVEAFRPVGLQLN